jgi:anti-sigma factor RsiW
VTGWLATERLLPQPMTPLAAELASKHLLYGEGRGGALALVTSEPAKMGGWFQGRLGFPVRLPAVAKRTERLVGGRISSLADAPAAYALYDRSGQSISLFVTASAGDEDALVEFALLCVKGGQSRHGDAALHARLVARSLAAPGSRRRPYRPGAS